MSARWAKGIKRAGDLHQGSRANVGAVGIAHRLPMSHLPLRFWSAEVVPSIAVKAKVSLEPS